MGRCAVSTQKQKRPFALRALAAFAGTLAILFVLLLAAYALPGERVRQHVYDSARTIQNEGLYPEYLGFKLFQMDNYTDTLMLFEAASADELPPLQAMMTNTAYNVDNFETLADDLAWYIEKDWSTGAQRTDAPVLEPFSYARYWHGYLIWLRPLLLLMPYTGVRIVQYIVLFALLAVVLVLGLRYASLFFGWRTKPPRDYSDVVTRAVSKPVRSVANRVRPPKGKVERDKERHGYEKLRAFWARMNGEYVAERSKDDKLAASDSQAARSSAGTAAASDPSDRIIVDREELHRIMGGEEEKPRDPFEPRS